MVNSAATGRLPLNNLSSKIRSDGQKNISQVEGPSSTSQKTSSFIQNRVEQALTTGLEDLKSAKPGRNSAYFRISLSKEVLVHLK